VVIKGQLWSAFGGMQLKIQMNLKDAKTEGRLYLKFY
jgi:hypothetical protein